MGEDDERAERRSLLERHGAEAGQWSSVGPDPWRALWNESRTAFVVYVETRHVIFLWRTPSSGPSPNGPRCSRPSPTSRGAPGAR